jgi:hypothetical protein
MFVVCARAFCCGVNFAPPSARHVRWRDSRSRMHGMIVRGRQRGARIRWQADKGTGSHRMSRATKRLENQVQGN